MEPSSGVILLMFVGMIISTVVYLRANDKIAELEETVSNLYGDIQVLEIREMHLKEQLKETMIENDFLYS